MRCLRGSGMTYRMIRTQANAGVYSSLLEAEPTLEVIQSPLDMGWVFF